MTRIDKFENRQSKTTQRRLTVDDELHDTISLLSHDLRTPLVVAHGFSDLLVKYCKNLSKLIDKPELSGYFDEKTSTIIRHDIPQSVDYILASLKEMDELIVEMTDVSQPSAKGTPKQGMGDILT